jgi:hypothetical protein
MSNLTNKPVHLADHFFRHPALFDAMQIFVQRIFPFETPSNAQAVEFVKGPVIVPVRRGVSSNVRSEQRGILDVASRRRGKRTATLVPLS